jgi:cell division control protein 7
MFSTNVPDVRVDGISWQEFVERQNPDIRTPKPPDYRYYPYTFPAYSRATPSEEVPPLTSSSPSRSGGSRSQSPTTDPFAPTNSLASPATQKHIQDLENAYDFLEKVLCADSTQRITPREALYHDFLKPTEGEEPYVNMDDDLFFPHPAGTGVCGGLHSIDPETNTHSVKIEYSDGTADIHTVAAGEGIAIGDQPCEFHQYLLQETDDVEIAEAVQDDVEVV